MVITPVPLFTLHHLLVADHTELPKTKVQNEGTHVPNDFRNVEQTI